MFEPHVCFFVYDADASSGARYVAICRGCGAVNVTQLKTAPALTPTEIPGVWDIPSIPHRDRFRLPRVFD